jgi:CHASE3 domain sensor protein
MWIDQLIIRLNSKVKWRVSQKLTALIGILILSLVITGALSIYTLSLFNERFEKTLDSNIQRTIIAAQMNDDLMRFDRLVVEYIRSRYQADRTAIEVELSGINTHFNASILKLKHLKQDSTNNAILSELEPSWDEYCRTIQNIIIKSRSNDFEGAMELWDGWASVRYRDIKYLIKEVISFNFELAQTSKVKANQSFWGTLFRIVGIILVTCVISVLLGIVIIRYLQISLKNLILANERVSRGHLSQGVDLAINYNARDELGELAESNRKVVESIQRMVSEVTALTEKYVPQSEMELPEGEKEKQFTNLIDMEKTSALVQDLTDSLELVKYEIEQVCKSELMNRGLEEAHLRTLTTIDNFNKEIQKLYTTLDSLVVIPEKFDHLVARYGSLEQLAGGLKADEILEHLQRVAAEIINTMEVVKFGLLDQKMLLDSRSNTDDGIEANSYFANLAKAIKNIINRADTITTKAKQLQSGLEQVVFPLKMVRTDHQESLSETVQEINEFQILLAKLEGMMVGFNK